MTQPAGDPRHNALAMAARPTLACMNSLRPCDLPRCCLVLVQALLYDTIRWLTEAGVDAERCIRNSGPSGATGSH